MSPLEGIAVPQDGSIIELVLQDPGNGPAFKWIPPPGPPVVFIAGSGDGSHIFPIIIGLENVFHDLIGLFIDHKRFSFSYSLVSKGRRGLIALS